MWKSLINMLKNAFVLTNLRKLLTRAVTDSVEFIFVKPNSFLFLIVKRKYDVHDLTVKQYIY